MLNLVQFKAIHTILLILSLSLYNFVFFFLPFFVFCGELKEEKQEEKNLFRKGNWYNIKCDVDFFYSNLISIKFLLYLARKKKKC